MQALPALDPDADLAELREYLGDGFDPTALERWQESVNEELARVGSEEELYRTSQAYLYNLTVFAMSGTKEPYLDEIVRRLPPGSRLLDYGCGIGSDGLRLVEAGYDVAFADFANPSVEYLRWRLERRGVEARIYDLDHETPSGYDLAYAFDVIEHVDHPFDMLGCMERAADRVLVNLLEEDPCEQEPHHRALPMGPLLRHATARGLVSYRVHHGRSHLVLYESERGRGVADLLRGARELVRGARRGDLPAIILPIPWDFRPWRGVRDGHQPRHPDAR
jgi:SAM-dependent methyltransferase